MFFAELGVRSTTNSVLY